MICEEVKFKKKDILSKKWKTIVFFPLRDPVCQQIVKTELTDLLWEEIAKEKDIKYGQLMQNQKNGVSIYAIALDMPLSTLIPEHIVRHIDNLQISDSEKILFLYQADKTKLSTVNLKRLRKGLNESNKQIVLCVI